MTFDPANTLSSFVRTTYYFPDNFSEFRVKFLEVYDEMSYAINLRDNGIFDQREIITGQTWSSTDPQTKRYTFRKIFFIGSVAAGGTLTTAHNITQFSTLTFTSLYGSVITSAGSFNQRQVPFSSVSAVTDQIQLDADNTNFRVQNGATAPNITSGIIVLEYLKN